MIRWLARKIFKAPHAECQHANRVLLEENRRLRAEADALRLLLASAEEPLVSEGIFRPEECSYFKPTDDELREKYTQWNNRERFEA